MTTTYELIKSHMAPLEKRIEDLEQRLSALESPATQAKADADLRDWYEKVFGGQRPRNKRVVLRNGVFIDKSQDDA